MMAIKAKTPLSHHRSNSPMLTDKENNGSTNINKHRFSPRIVSDNVAGTAAAKRKSGISSNPRTRAVTPPAKFSSSSSSERKPLKDLRTPTPQNRRNSTEKVAGSNPRCLSNPIGSGSVRRTSSLDLISKGFLAGERSRTPDFKPKEKERERASSAARVKNRTSTWSRDRTPRSSNELNGSTDSGPKSSSCLTRKVSISGSGRIIIPAQNGLKKNCGLDSGKAFSGSTGSGKGLAEHVKRHIQERKNHGDVINKISDGVSKNQRGSRQQDGSRCQEVGGALTTAASPNARRALRVAATPLQKVLLNNCDATPSPRFIDKGCDSSTTPSSGLKGRYENLIPIKCRKDGVFSKQRGDFTPSPTIIGRRGVEFTPAPSNTNGKRGDFTSAPEANGKGRDFTPAPNSNGNGGDFTPAPNSNGNGGNFTPAHYSVNATPEQRTQVTPPVQPSISPDIHSQTLDGIEDGHHHRCFGAGHFMAPAPGKVGDRRKCRPRGILIAGEATFIPLNENRRFSLVPVPAVASVKWMSPADAKNLTNPATTQDTPSSGFTEGTPSNALKNPCSQVTPPFGLNHDTPSSGYSSGNPGPHDTPLSRIFENSPSPGPISTPSPQTGRPLFCINRAAPCSGLSATPPPALSSETQNLSTLTRSGFTHEVPLIRGVSSSGLTTRTGYLESTPSSGVTSKFQNLIATPSSTSSKFQNRVFTPPSGSNPEILNLHPTYPYENKQDVLNLQANSTHGFSWHSRYPSNLDISPEYRFSPDISPHHSALQEATPTRSSQLGFNPCAFPQDSKLHGSSSSLVNLVIPSQCAACSDGVSSTTPKVSSIAKDTSRQEMQVPFSRDITLARISWREGLVSRIFKLSDLDLCDLILDRDGKRKEDENESMYRENELSNTKDDVEYSSPFNSNLQPDAPFGSFEYMSETNAEKSDPLVSSLLEENILSQSLIGSHISSASPGLGTKETIDAEDITTSAERDWTFCYENQLFEGAT